MKKPNYMYMILLLISLIVVYAPTHADRAPANNPSPLNTQTKKVMVFETIPGKPESKKTVISRKNTVLIDMDYDFELMNKHGHDPEINAIISRKQNCTKTNEIDTGSVLHTKSVKEDVSRTVNRYNCFTTESSESSAK